MGKVPRHAYLNGVFDMKAMKVRDRRAINKQLNALDNYHDAIPLKEIFGILRASGYIAVQEDGEPWSGMLVGSNEWVQIEIQDSAGNPVNTSLNLGWYKRDESNRYEITVYIS